MKAAEWDVPVKNSRPDHLKLFLSYVRHASHCCVSALFKKIVTTKTLNVFVDCFR